jgi:hypothetical protein
MKLDGGGPSTPPENGLVCDTYIAKFLHDTGNVLDFACHPGHALQLSKVHVTRWPSGEEWVKTETAVQGRRVRVKLEERKMEK